MKKSNVVFGVDVSKLTLDICCIERNLHLKISNCSKGFTILKKWCKGNDISLNDVLMVMEFTGGYEYRFLQFCESLSIPYCRIPGLEIKRSLGMIRGKSDKIDAFRICQYGKEKIGRLQPDKPLDNNILALKQLLSFRKRLVREKAGLESTIKERKHMYPIKTTDLVTRIAEAKVKANEKYITQVENEIAILIKSNESLLLNYRIVTSIKGIGPVNAWMTIAYTENFTTFPDGRHYAVFVGVVPFEHTSGTSIKKRKRVSCLANKELKQELNQAAKSAIAYDPEIRAYAERKLKNKPYPLVLNNVKFKLILRMFSLVKRKVMYVDNYNAAA
jgi:transposase